MVTKTRYEIGKGADIATILAECNEAVARGRFVSNTKPVDNIPKYDVGRIMGELRALVARGEYPHDNYQGRKTYDIRRN